MTIKIGIIGAAGRMGQRLVAISSTDKELQLTAAIDSESHPNYNCDAGELAGIGKIGVRLSSQIEMNANVFIDFSSPKATDSVLIRCTELGIPLVLATTGLSPQQHAHITEAAKVIPLLHSPSMSMSVNLAMQLCETAGKILKDTDADIEIIEKHHRFKADAPSGTALKFGKIIADAMQLASPNERHGRHGAVGMRQHNEIGYHAVRIGDNPGEHTILFGLLGETLEITVKATNRDCYAAGALAAAKFLHNKPAGLYAMSDVLRTL